MHPTNSSHPTQSVTQNSRATSPSVRETNNRLGLVPLTKDQCKDTVNKFFAHLPIDNRKRYDN